MNDTPEQIYWTIEDLKIAARELLPYFGVVADDDSVCIRDVELGPLVHLRLAEHDSGLVVMWFSRDCPPNYAAQIAVELDRIIDVEVDMEELFIATCTDSTEAST